MGMKWEQLAWDRRFDAAPRTYRVPRAQFDRPDKSFLRREEQVGDHRVVLVQLNQYRKRTKLFRIETWSINPDVEAPMCYYEEATQTAADKRFEQVVSEFTEMETEGDAC